MLRSRVALDATTRHSPLVLLNSDHKPWTPDGFRVSFGKAQRKAGVTGVTFNDLRGTAVTRLAVAGASEAEIATITGHALAGCPIDPRFALPKSRPRSGPQRHRQARKENEISQLNSQLA